MTFGFAPPTNASRPASADSAARLGRMLEPSEWASAGIPLLRNPREIVTGLHDRHRPGPSTAIVAVLDPLERVAASASFTEPAALPDGWAFRNVLLAHLRRVIPHDLRLRTPVRTAVLLYCRDGEPRWTEADGAWMWGLRDACTLHGLRCGAYITLTPDRWQVLGEDRGGRPPRPARRADPAPRPTEPSPARAPRALSARMAASGAGLAHMPSPRTPPAESSAGAEPPSRRGTSATPRRFGGGAREPQRHTAAR
ncbi:hypothetical protein [Streptomyces sp. NPDC053427]|uniref:hypothetical protein n=1 Tax=Streptomyces sp. NPDC053427 TaxID=3365701 RepID=UPI0037D1B23A